MEPDRYLLPFCQAELTVSQKSGLKLHTFKSVTAMPYMAVFGKTSDFDAVTSYIGVIGRAEQLLFMHFFDRS